MLITKKKNLNMIKLSKLLTESKDKVNITEEEKSGIMERISNFSKFGERVYRTDELKKVVSEINELCEQASNLVLQETADWFDYVTVNRDVKEIKNATRMFEKTAGEVIQLQQRLESLYEDIGYRLGKYYEIKENTDFIDDKEAEQDFEDLPDKDIDNDGDVDDSDEYLKHKLSVIAKKTESVNEETITEAFFSSAQLGRLKDEFSKISRVDPNSSQYKRMVNLMDNIPADGLKQIADANINFLSTMAKTRMKRGGK